MAFGNGKKCKFFELEADAPRESANHVSAFVANDVKVMPMTFLFNKKGYLRRKFFSPSFRH